MTTALLNEDGELARYPYTVDDLRADHPGTVFFLPLDSDTMSHYRMVAVQAATAPVPAASQTVQEVDPVFVEGALTQQWALVECPAPVIAARRQAMIDSIDAACAAIYTRVGRFSEEYKEREAQAIAFKAAGYTGTVPRQVAAFATPAGVTPTYATDLILSQAAQLRGALSALGELRMRKYELKADSLGAAVAAHAQIMAAINAIGAAL